VFDGLAPEDASCYRQAMDKTANTSIQIVRMRRVR
jgi:hypothetical protein